MFTSLIEAAKALIGAAGTLQKLGDDRRSKLASYFDAINVVLLGIVDRKLRKEKAHDLCAELGVYAGKIREVAATTLADDEITRLADELTRAEQSRAMMFMTELPNDKAYENYAEQLAEAAGVFRGLANTLRAK